MYRLSQSRLQCSNRSDSDGEMERYDVSRNVVLVAQNVQRTNTEVNSKDKAQKLRYRTYRFTRSKTKNNIVFSNNITGRPLRASNKCSLQNRDSLVLDGNSLGVG